MSSSEAVRETVLVPDLARNLPIANAMEWENVYVGHTGIGHYPSQSLINIYYATLIAINVLICCALALSLTYWVSCRFRFSKEFNNDRSARPPRENECRNDLRVKINLNLCDLGMCPEFRFPHYEDRASRKRIERNWCGRPDGFWRGCR